MEFTTLLLIFAVVGGFIMAFSMGANDVSNAMAPAVGAKAITVGQAVFIASILNFVGAVFLGSHVTATISKGIVNPASIPDQNLLMLGMFASLLSAGLWVLAATITALPVSSTHALVGSILGFGLVAGGPDTVEWKGLLGIIAAWVISPFFGGLLAYFVFMHIRRTILFSHLLVKAALRWAPIWCALTVVMVVLSFCYKTPYGKSLHLESWHGIAIALAVSLVTIWLVRLYMPRLIHPEKPPMEVVEEIFRRMQVGTASYVALSHGASDVSNAIGPVLVIWYVAKDGFMAADAPIPIWILVMGGVGIAAGTLLLGRKVMDTVGHKITQMNNTRGFAVSFSAATTVLIASNMGLPVSSTHATIGSVMGVGLARGFQSVDFRVLSKIVLYWVLTIPISGFSCIIIFQILRWTLL